MAKILIVDDELHMRAALYDILEYAGYQVRAVGSGEEALDEIKASQPDLLLCDIRMPGGINGLELGQSLRANSDWQKIPIIFLSARSHPEQDEEIATLQPAIYVRKPFEVGDLMEIVAATLADSAA